MSKLKQGILQYSCCANSLTKGWITFVKSVKNTIVTSSRLNNFCPLHPVCSCEPLQTTGIISSLGWPGLKNVQPVRTGEGQHLLQIKTAQPPGGEGKEQNLYRKIPLIHKCQAHFQISETLVLQNLVPPLLPPYSRTTVNLSNGGWKKQSWVQVAAFSSTHQTWWLPMSCTLNPVGLSRVHCTQAIHSFVSMKTQIHHFCITSVFLHTFFYINL